MKDSKIVKDNAKSYGVNSSEAEAGFSNETQLENDSMAYPDDGIDKARNAGGFMKRGATTVYDPSDEK